MTDKQVNDLFEKYGNIVSIKRATHKTMPNILDGRIMLSYQYIAQELPDSIMLGKSRRIIIREPGQKVRRTICYKCGEVETHLAQDCPGSTVCFECKQQGHRHKDCPSKRAKNINKAANIKLESSLCSVCVQFLSGLCPVCVRFQMYILKQYVSENWTQTGHKLDTKLDTNWTQTEHKLDTNWAQTGHKTGQT